MQKPNKNPRDYKFLRRPALLLEIAISLSKFSAQKSTLSIQNIEKCIFLIYKIDKALYFVLISGEMSLNGILL